MGQTWAVFVHSCWCASCCIYSPFEAVAGCSSSSPLGRGILFLLMLKELYYSYFEKKWAKFYCIKFFVFTDMKWKNKSQHFQISERILIHNGSTMGIIGFLYFNMCIINSISLMKTILLIWALQAQYMHHSLMTCGLLSMSINNGLYVKFLKFSFSWTKLLDLSVLTWSLYLLDLWHNSKRAGQINGWAIFKFLQWTFGNSISKTLWLLFLVEANSII